MKRHWLFFIICCLTCGTLFSGCGVIQKIAKFNLDETATTEIVGKPKKEIPVSMYQKDRVFLSMDMPTDLNPYSTQPMSVHRILTLIYQPLITINQEGRLKFELAKNVELTNQADSCLVDLREISFHDGSSLTTDDVIYSYQLSRQEKSAYRYVTDNIARLKRIDSKRLQIDFKTAGYWNLFSLSFPIVKQKSGAQMVATMNGTGPFQLENYKPMQSMILRGTTHSVEITFLRKASYHKEAFLNRLTDIYYAETIRWSDFSEELLGNMVEYPSFYYHYVGINYKNSFLADEKNRRYLYLLVDWPNLNKNIYFGHLLPKMLPVLLNRQMEQKILFDLPTASQMDLPILKKYVMENPALGRYRLIYDKHQPFAEGTAKMLKENWKTVLSIDLIGLDSKEYEEALQKGDFDLFVARVKMDYFPKVEDYFRSDGRYNYGQLNQPAVDQLIDQVSVATTEEALLAGYQQLANQQLEKWYWFPLGIEQTAIIMQPSVNGYPEASPYYPLKGLENLK